MQRHDKSNETTSTLSTKINGLLKTQYWNQFAATHFVEITNEFRRD
ncbi:unnamed protein product, partial [Rotaria sp. Silwood2]